MSAVTYPSPDFPAFAGISVDVPDGWEPRVLPAAQLVMVEPAGAGPFRANVVVTVSRFAGEATLDAVAGQAVARMAGAPGFRELGRESAERGGFPTFRLSGSWTDPQVGEVSQTVTLYEVAHHGVRDLVEVTTSSGGGEGAPAWPAVQAIQESVRVSTRATE
ncbi:hypothetical protein Xcel_0497 [Xylanimonas cellulosilytica DSM 15894]|uniref:Lipoprotein LpqN n=1 Tax=Xylanimonas cellulosilytica (strain DSM 15894 / JCM 12276 / CECT 5975 / KCTC 9989 / LMG 20990 / NBRC 107835 / XIL07) TaxID=446471 RepID=D1BW33_XYLCX|nr:LpqN/LpqT family lipoprotein [Xylanimonas cellulosilytica]ACZ29536.1 hypothetical protein Xcel_0497 [Xylanimonas cellulosilytica DSM 15894]